jgi:hypothetical protein
VKKEKVKIKTEVQSHFLTNAPKRGVYLRDGQLVESSGEGSDEEYER